MRKPIRIDKASGRQRANAAAAMPPAAPAAPNQQSSAFGQGCGVVIAILFALFLVGKCSSGPSDVAGNSAQAALSEPAYIAARSLNCRREPAATAAVSEGLTRDEQVIVAERRAEWARLTRAGGDCWVSSSFLASAPRGVAGAGGSPPVGVQALTSSDTISAVAAAGSGYVAAESIRPSRKHTASKRRGGSRGRRGSSGGYSGSGCPCSGSQVCIGPRGGRYCITSGGNKRYGV